jgi:large subunit ribosomal protein L5e
MFHSLCIQTTVFRSYRLEESAQRFRSGCITRLVDVPDFTQLLICSQMPFVKKIKSDAYFSRFQVKYRRRREGKTDCTHNIVTYLSLVVTFCARLCAQAASSAGKKQVVSYRPWMRETFQTTLSTLSNAPKYRLVVRFTNKDIIVQIVYARLQGDFVLAAAHSRELPRYGINHGLTNWAAGTRYLLGLK